MNKSLRAAIYIRVSTEEQHLNGLSLPAQKKALTEFAERNGYHITDYYADEGISARKPMKYRKGLLRLLEDVKRDKLDMILVSWTDGFAISKTTTLPKKSSGHTIAIGKQSMKTTTLPLPTGRWSSISCSLSIRLNATGHPSVSGPSWTISAPSEK